MQEAFLNNRRNTVREHVSGTSNLVLGNKVGFLVKILDFSQQNGEVKEGKMFEIVVNRCKVLR